jgi:hypothetical protein
MILKEPEKLKFRHELKEHIQNHCLFIADPNKQYNEATPIGTIAPNSIAKKGSTYQWYMRRLTHNPRMLSYASYLMFDSMMQKINDGKEYPQFQLVGLETGSLPLIAGIQAVAMNYNLEINAFTIRKSRKTYGLFNFVEGTPNNTPVVFIDDLVNSGSSFARCMDICLYEFDLDPSRNMYSIINNSDDEYPLEQNGILVEKNTIFNKNDFDISFNSDRYWEPFDCDKSFNKRPDYK